MTPLVKLLNILKIVFVYKNGDGISAVFNYYNPLTWIFLCFWIPAAIVYYSFDGGILNADLSGLGFCVDRYFKQHPEELEWL